MKNYESVDRDPLTGKVIACAIAVHREMGPGLLESTYEHCLAAELSLHNIPFERQLVLPVEYRGIVIACAYRVDFMIDDRLIIELKAVSAIHDLHRAQILAYMKLSNVDTGLLINFNAIQLKQGIQRFRL